MDQKIKIFLNSKAFGVVGASTDRSKFGNKVLRCYMQHKLNINSMLSLMGLVF